MKWVLPKTYTNPVYPFKRSPDQDAQYPARHKVVVVGAGPSGLASALDLAQRDIPCVVLSKENTVSIGSRAICFAKKTLEIIHRLDPLVARRMLDKGVTWQVGKVFYQEEKVYEFNLLSEKGHKFPAFINLQQYYFEEYLVDAVQAHPLIDLRWESELVDLEPAEDKVSLQVQSPDGLYEIETDYLLACDGVHSFIRQEMGIAYEGEQFEENFLIADITMEKKFPAERWFWFDPPFNPGYSALLHKQPDGVWRVDLQLGWDIDKDQELDPERIRHRLSRMLGEEVKFELEWTSIYQFRCMRMDKFIHGRVLFAGDSAHLVSPFGARGANSGIQDTDNLIWKLAYVLQGKAPRSLLNSYQLERSPATDENIYHSSNSTDFISPKSEISLAFRNATLELASEQGFARQWVNSGRLSHAFRYIGSPLNTSDGKEKWSTSLQPGYSISDLALLGPDGPLQLLDLLGNDFTIILFHSGKHEAEVFFNRIQIETMIPLKTLLIHPGYSESDGFLDDSGTFAERYDVKEGSWYLVRPDHYIAARGREMNTANIIQTLHSALGNKPHQGSQREQPDPFALYEKDAWYKMLIKAHEGLSTEESQAFNAKMILMLMNQMESKKEFQVFLEAALTRK